MRARILAVLLTAPLALVLAPVHPAQAATTHTCDGLTANLWGTDGDDTNDTLQGTPNPLGNNVVWLGPGDDKYQGGAGNDTICGGDGVDAIDGGPGNDTIDGGAGNDYLVGAAGDDTIIGGAGKADVVSYLASTAGIKVDGASGTVTGSYDGTDTYSGVERVRGSRYADTMTGGDERDWFEGQGGADRISGGGGNDVLSDNAGVVWGGAGKDALTIYGTGVGHGGPGSDLIRLRNHAVGYGESGRDVFYMGVGRPKAYGGADNDHFAMRYGPTGSWVYGGSGDNVMTFHGVRYSVRANLSTGMARWGKHWTRLKGIHSLIGSLHNDHLVGSSGRDYISGSQGDDVILGKGGNDLLIGGRGHDTADGGAGADICSAEVVRSCEVH